MTSIREDGTIEFRFFRPGASDVNVAGDFNDWARQGIEMVPECDGWWTGLARLAPGEYRFRYRADGQWFTDFAAHGIEPSKFGWNSVLVVREKRDASSTSGESQNITAKSVAA
jgi:1,4-alpha-glucan branching enzyme